MEPKTEDIIPAMTLNKKLKSKCPRKKSRSRWNDWIAKLLCGRKNMKEK
jgi:hypothetical protein